MTRPLIDTHCHLDLFPDIARDPLQEDTDGIKTISVTNAPYLYEHNATLFANAKHIRIAVGLHPELAMQFSEQVGLFEATLGASRYVGEIGLDGSPRFAKTFDMQKEVFVKLLEAIRKAGSKIITVHTRNAATETIALLKQYLRGTGCKVILHWYTGDAADLKAAVGHGYYFSINHKMISTDKGKQLIRLIPKQQILTETDAPFTLDGIIKTRKQSLEATVRGLAALFSMTEDAVRELVYGNFQAVLAQRS